MNFEVFRRSWVEAIELALQEPPVIVFWENDGLNAHQGDRRVILSVVSHIPTHDRVCQVDELTQTIYSSHDITLQARCEGNHGGFCEDGYQLATKLRMALMRRRVVDFLAQNGIVVSGIKNAPGAFTDISPDTSPNHGHAVSRAYLEIPVRFVEEQTFVDDPEDSPYCITTIDIT